MCIHNCVSFDKHKKLASSFVTFIRFSFAFVISIVRVTIQLNQPLHLLLWHMFLFTLCNCHYKFIFFSIGNENQILAYSSHLFFII